jgi:hypothetical protein
MLVLRDKQNGGDATSCFPSRGPGEDAVAVALSHRTRHGEVMAHAPVSLVIRAVLVKDTTYFPSLDVPRDGQHFPIDSSIRSIVGRWTGQVLSDV